MKSTYKISGKMKRQIAEYYVANESTVRKTAKYFGISKSYVHRALVEFQSDYGTCGTELARQVAMLTSKNLDERAKRGGTTTKLRYKKRID